MQTTPTPGVMQSSRYKGILVGLQPKSLLRGGRPSKPDWVAQSCTHPSFEYLQWCRFHSYQTNQLSVLWCLAANNSANRDRDCTTQTFCFHSNILLLKQSFAAATQSRFRVSPSIAMQKAFRISLQNVFLWGSNSHIQPHHCFTLFLYLFQKQVLHGCFLCDVRWDFTFTVHSSHISSMTN